MRRGTGRKCLLIWAAKSKHDTGGFWVAPSAGHPWESIFEGERQGVNPTSEMATMTGRHEQGHRDPDDLENK